jgi:aminoglycoside phosphotransferase (APT) family kinase protein
VRGELIGVGRTAEVYAWGADRALKLYKDWVRREDVERELALTRAAREAGLPAPAADCLVEDEGRIGIVMERVVGESMLKALRRAPSRLGELAGLLGELHAEINSKALPASSGSQRGFLVWAIGKAASLGEAERAAAESFVAALPDGEAACHGDFHPDNVILAERGPVVIDWMSAARGSPEADAARSSLLLRMGALSPGLFGRLVDAPSRALLDAAYLRSYVAARPGSRELIDLWRAPIAAARIFELEGFPAEGRLVLRETRRRLGRASARARRGLK